MLTEGEQLPRAPAWFAHDVAGARHLGVVDPSRADSPWLDVGPLDELELLRAGRLDTAHVAELAASGTPLSGEPSFAVPIAHPRKILCLGKNFAAHAAEFGAEVPKEPIFFTKLHESLLPHRGTVLLPHWLDTRVDHEIELAVILGFHDPDARGRKYVSPDDAMSLVGGYSILNDVTARKMQGDDRGERKPWLRCKSFDTFCPVGPWVVPQDNHPTIHDAAIRIWVNDELRQDSRTSLMVTNIQAAIAYLSRHTSLHSGDIIAMGTPAGVRPLQPGDHMLGHIEGLGALANDVARELD